MEGRRGAMSVMYISLLQMPVAAGVGIFVQDVIRNSHCSDID